MTMNRNGNGVSSPMMSSRDEGRRATDERIIEQSWRKAAVKKYGDQQNALIERGWAAGFFDGEGSVRGAQGKGVRCSIEQTITGEKQSTENDVTGSIKGLLNLERFRNAIGGVGEITPRTHRKRGNEQATCEWTSTSQKGLQAVFAAIGEFLSLEKRNQLSDALGIPAITAMKQDKPLPDGGIGVEVNRRRPAK